MSNAFGKRLAVRSLINTDTQIQRGDLNLAEGTVFVVEVTAHLREQRRGLIAAAAHGAAGGDNAGGTAANDRAGCGYTTGSKVGGKVFSGMQRIHTLRAKDGRNEGGVLADVGIFHSAAIRRVDDLDGGVPAEVVIVRRVNAVFQG